jgi:hypothetical protein
MPSFHHHWPRAMNALRPASVEPPGHTVVDPNSEVGPSRKGGSLHVCSFVRPRAQAATARASRLVYSAYAACSRSASLACTRAARPYLAMSYARAASPLNAARQAICLDVACRRTGMDIRPPRCRPLAHFGRHDQSFRGDVIDDCAGSRSERSDVGLSPMFVLVRGGLLFAA